MKFKLGKRGIRVTRWIFQRFRIRPGYKRLGGSSLTPAIMKFLNWGRKLSREAKSLICSNVKSGSGYVQIGSGPTPPVPKGYLGIYVGQKDSDEFRRVLVPVVYFNHPLFGELLKEAEDEFGFQHSSGITIPCRVTEFEQIKNQIASGSSCRRLTWRQQQGW